MRSSEDDKGKGASEVGVGPEEQDVAGKAVLPEGEGWMMDERAGWAEYVAVRGPGRLSQEVTGTSTEDSGLECIVAEDVSGCLVEAGTGTGGGGILAEIDGGG